ncbi:MAG: hypothetical protein KIT84_25820 [Labilithrix sp.]|nr:hypothetical protein [Labilithrix sp.]MCW5814472.1 hypothetical protein [Labilithrix sp.]
MTRSRRLRRAFALSTALVSGLFGCQLIVSSAAPDFRCEPGFPGACPEGQTCEPTARVCVASVTTEGGPSDVAPDRDTGGDGPAGDDDDAGGRAQLGEPCDNQRPCASTLLCGTSNLLTTAILASTTDAICTKTCCTSTDCGDGFVCFGAGTGGSYCVSAARAKREGLGTGAAGAECAAPSECRSGLCVDDHCLDTCCTAEHCTGETLCRVKSLAAPPPARENWVCALPEPGASLEAGTVCSGSTTRCMNDNCSGFPQKCRPTCCNSEQCAALHPSFTTCAYGEFTTTGSHTKWCFDSSGTRPLGEACNGNGDCASRFCDPDQKKCAAVCCQDTDCTRGEVCRPAASGTPFLRCVPAASPE